MKTRILKKISKRIEIVKVGKMYVVKRKIGWSWHAIYQSVLFTKALAKKHKVTHLILRDLNYRERLVKRRMKRKKK